MEIPLREKPLPVRSRNGIPLRIAVILFPAALLLVAMVSHAATFTASLDRDTISMGESATLTLTFEGGSPKNIPMPTIPNLQITSAGQSSQFNFVNGQTSSTVSHNFVLTPRQVGEFAIPSFTATVSGQKLSTPPLKLKVLKPNAPPPEAIQSGSQIAFLKLFLPKREVYVGEIVTAELQLYLRDVVQNFGNFQLAPLPTDGFTVGKMAEGQRRRVQIGNGIYTVIPISIALTAVKTGPVSIGPVTANVVVQLPSNNRRRDPFFDGFPDPFGMFGGNSEQKQLSLAADAESLQSLPLPTENVPSNFNGAVGSYTMNVSVGPTNVAVGDPITVRVQIAGRGVLDALTLPEQTAWQNFKTYPPTAKVETTDSLGLQGTKTFEQIVAPQNTSAHELPAFSFSYFDPDQKAYRTLTQPPTQLAIRPAGATPMPVIAGAKPASSEAPPPTQDIVHIKPRLGLLAQIGPPLVQQRWFIALQGVPVFAWLAALGWRKRAVALANNPRLRRKRQVAQTIRSGLADLRRLAAENKSDDFFATLFRLLQEQLGERLDCPATSITEAVIEEKLRPHGVRESTLTELCELFQTCNLARYAPIRTSQELAALVPRLEAVLQEIQNMKP